MAIDMQRAKVIMEATITFSKMESWQKAELLDFADDDGTAPPSWGHDLKLLDADYCTELGDCSTLNTVGETVVDKCQIWWDAQQAIVKGIEAKLADLAQDREPIESMPMHAQTDASRVAVSLVKAKEAALRDVLDQINKGKL